MELIKNLLIKESGMDFENFREIILERRVNQRVESLKCGNTMNYYYYLQKRISSNDRRELEELISLLTVNETFFHRDVYQFNFLKNSVFPELQKKNTIEILSLACATGEEPYSIAMEAMEYFGTDTKKIINITGCDIDKDALNKCMNSKYTADSRRLQNLPKYYLQKYFDYFEGYYTVKEFLKKKIKFLNLNITSHNFTGCYDVIFCKNVMMYFPKNVQTVLIRKIFKLLNSGGYFFIGATEIIDDFIDGLEKIVSGNSIFRKTDIKQNNNIVADSINLKPDKNKDAELQKVFDLNKPRDPKIFTVKISNSIDREHSAAGEYRDFIRKLNSLFDIKEKKIIIDMTETKFIDRYSIENMIKLAHILEKDGKIAIAVVEDGGLKNMLNRTEFHKKIKLASNMNEALKLLNAEISK
ncbi:protein-glutamate O-methyltransferase CheR [Candidatus Dependentiae bacterium]|nr:protein-glutamate O-methyltransferase CheR [Candidatus Dependentiae bacterium]